MIRRDEEIGAVAVVVAAADDGHAAEALPGSDRAAAASAVPPACRFGYAGDRSFTLGSSEASGWYCFWGAGDCIMRLRQSQ